MLSSAATFFGGSLEEGKNYVHLYRSREFIRPYM